MLKIMGDHSSLVVRGFRNMIEVFVNFLVCNIGNKEYEFTYQRTIDMALFNQPLTTLLSNSLTALENQKNVVFNNDSCNSIIQYVNNYPELRALMTSNKLFSVTMTSFLSLNNAIHQSDELIISLLRLGIPAKWIDVRDYGKRKDVTFDQKVRMFRMFMTNDIILSSDNGCSEILSVTGKSNINEFETYLKIFNLTCKDFENVLGMSFLIHGLEFVKYLLSNGAECKFFDNIKAILANRNIHGHYILPEKKILEFLHFVKQNDVATKTLYGNMTFDHVFKHAKQHHKDDLFKAALKSNSAKVFELAVDVFGFEISHDFLNTLWFDQGYKSELVSNKNTVRITKLLIAGGLLSKTALNNLAKEYPIFSHKIKEKSCFRNPQLYDLIYS